MEVTKRSIFWDNEGFSTLGVVLALLISLSLLFSAARIYEINTQSAAIQEVADAAALSAENVIAQYYTVAYVCDALLLSMSLGSVALAGVGLVALCVPSLQSQGMTCLEYSKKLRDVRNSFSDQAKRGLERLQTVLPFLSLCSASSVLVANSQESGGSHYVGLTLLNPHEGEPLASLAFDQSEAFDEAAQDNKDSIAQLAQEAEHLAQKAAESKALAYQHDSGSETTFCMYERANKLANLAPEVNPYYTSAELWDFSVALRRAQAYYAHRYEKETPTNQTVTERNKSHLRKQFYGYASREVNKGYVHETADSFDAFFPLLPKNTDEMRATTLYTDAVYPATQNGDGTVVIHVSSECAGIQQGVSLGSYSLAAYEATQPRVECDICEMSAASLGKVAAASSVIENGFEYHYNIVAEQAAQYQKAREELDPYTKGIKGTLGSLFNQAKKALDEASSCRIATKPPGRLGVVAIVIDLSARPSSGSFASSFVEDNATLGPRMALSSATLLPDDSDEVVTVLNTVLDGYAALDGGSATGSLRVVLDLWSSMLNAYIKGQEGFITGVEDTLNSLPFASQSGLGTWAAQGLTQTFEKINLAPCELAAPKPVLLNSVHVLAAGDDSFAQTLHGVKMRALTYGGATEEFVDEMISSAEQSALASVSSLGQEITIASLELFDGAVSIPITIALPAEVIEYASSLVGQGFDYLRGLSQAIIPDRRWE